MENKSLPQHFVFNHKSWNMTDRTRASSMFVAQDYFTGSACCHRITPEVSVSCILSLIYVHLIAFMQLLRWLGSLYVAVGVHQVTVSLPVFHNNDTLFFMYLSAILNPFCCWSPLWSHVWSGTVPSAVRVFILSLFSETSFFLSVRWFIIIIF